jgi:Sulfotransferase family
MTLDERHTRPGDALDGGSPRSSSAARIPALISVGGASRSGSTLLTLLLGRSEGAFPVGELRYIWSRGLRMNMLCGCGVPFRDCPFWRAVLADAYGAIDSVPAAELERLQDSVAGIFKLPGLLAGVSTAAYRRVSLLEAHLVRLCRSIREVAGARSLIDSSKLASYCVVLTRAHGDDARLVHLVRDSRAVAFSFMRHKHKPDIHWRQAEMKRFSPLKSSLDWNGLNLSMEAVGLRRPTLLMRYEDLANDPASELLRAMPEITRTSSLSASSKVPLAENHTVSGNPLRFTAGELQIRADDEWRSAMRAADRRLVTAATAPLLARYGYL